MCCCRYKLTSSPRRIKLGATGLQAFTKTLLEYLPWYESKFRSTTSQELPKHGFCARYVHLYQGYLGLLPLYNLKHWNLKVSLEDRLYFQDHLGFWSKCTMTELGLGCFFKARYVGIWVEIPSLSRMMDKRSSASQARASGREDKQEKNRTGAKVTHRSQPRAYRLPCGCGDMCL